MDQMLKHKEIKVKLIKDRECKVLERLENGIKNKR